MKNINVYVEKAKDGIYWGTSTNAPGVVSAFGKTLAELKRNFEQAYLDYLEVAREIGEEWYEEFENADFTYEMNL